MADLEVDDCILAFIAAARVQAEVDLNKDIEAERVSDPPEGRDKRVEDLIDARDQALVDLSTDQITDAARSNFGPLGTAAHSILTVRGEPSSDAASDQIFWKWVQDVHAWMDAVTAHINPEDPRHPAPPKIPALPATAPQSLKSKFTKQT